MNMLDLISPKWFPLLSSLFVLISVGILVRWLLKPEQHSGTIEGDPYESERLDGLRAQSRVYRSFEPKVNTLSRLPFVIDQISLMMKAGGGFEESLRIVAAEDLDHPMTRELKRMLADAVAGRTRRDALLEFKSRIPDEEIGELITGIVKGEELGTPLSVIVANQADQMRIKRSQWGEKAAAEAEVQIVSPACW